MPTTEKMLENKSITVSVNIQGQNYFLSCHAENQQALLDAAKRVNHELNSAHNNSNSRGSERITIIAAISLALQLEQLEKSVSNGQALPVDQLNATVKNILLKLHNALENT